ncbi:DUF6087 family protein [Streptomyces camelliae]|uniref:DUF6087 family protein n=1 Tax=Streptomyces camelliae TaxID=3004093 RepID=A0ABY7PD17_9ACTN|nr:DUF6087 family protein [Streptomyces sp. HUAS 2-6]WBO68514.1 DUF6087 family protein [Streptomyces sp. HUAS 2-6]
MPLAEGPHRAAHAEPDAPRVIQRWNGTQGRPSVSSPAEDRER